jgi:hypothetical protein
MKYTTVHKTHDRTSCDDEHPVNADPEGSTGCARCTAIELEQGRAAIQLLWKIAAEVPPRGRAASRPVLAAREFLKDIGKFEEHKSHE